MADTDRSLLASTGQNQLAHGSLRLWDAIAISVSVLAPGMAMLLNTSGVAIEAGSVHPAPPGILRWTPYVALVWLVVGVAVVLWLRARRPEAVERIGSILGEEGGTDATVLDA